MCHSQMKQPGLFLRCMSAKNQIHLQEASLQQHWNFQICRQLIQRKWSLVVSSETALAWFIFSESALVCGDNRWLLPVIFHVQFHWYFIMLILFIKCFIRRFIRKIFYQTDQVCSCLEIWHLSRIFSVNSSPLI